MPLSDCIACSPLTIRIIYTMSLQFITPYVVYQIFTCIIIYFSSVHFSTLYKWVHTVYILFILICS